MNQLTRQTTLSGSDHFKVDVVHLDKCQGVEGVETETKNRGPRLGFWKLTVHGGHLVPVTVVSQTGLVCHLRSQRNCSDPSAQETEMDPTHLQTHLQTSPISSQPHNIFQTVNHLFWGAQTWI